MEDALWERVLAFDEASHEYFAERAEWPGALVFTCPEADPFNLALIRGAPAPDPEALLEAIVAHYRGQRVTPRVRLTPLSQPADWAERLARRGFVEQPEATETFMALAAQQPLLLPAGRPPDPTIAIQRLRDAAGAAQFVDMMAAVFGLPDTLREWSIDLARPRLTAGTYRYYLAFVEGEPAGGASARLTDGITGLYGIGTLEGFRRRGLCTALVRHMLEEGRSEGHPLGFLSAQTGAYAEGLYARMGFERLFSVRTYELPLECS